MNKDVKNCVRYMLSRWAQIPSVIKSTFDTVYVLASEIADTVSLLLVCVGSLILLLVMPFFFWLAPVIVYISKRNQKLKPKQTTDLWDYQNKSNEKDKS